LIQRIIKRLNKMMKLVEKIGMLKRPGKVGKTVMLIVGLVVLVYIILLGESAMYIYSDEPPYTRPPTDF
jgi:hypothetical protein